MTLEAVLVEVFAFDAGEISDALELREIESWDSMTHMLLIARIEEVFTIQLTGDEIADMRSIADIREALRKRGKS